MPDDQLRAFENGIWLCDEHAGEVDKNPSEYPPDLLRQWKEDAEAYVETLITQDTRLRQLRMMAMELLSTTRLLTAIPGPGNTLDQTFRTPGHIPVSRILIEVEQTLFENDFRKEADLVREIGRDICRIEELMSKKPEGAYLDISAWKNRSVQRIMTDVMQFSPESFARYESSEHTMVSEKLDRLQDCRVVAYFADLAEIPSA